VVVILLRLLYAGREAALEMMIKCGEWRLTELESSDPPSSPPFLLKTIVENNFEVGGFDTADEGASIVGHALYGEDKEGRPVYWERTGQISRDFQQVKKLYTVDDLINAHIR
jgi:hypothetical protein